MKLTLTLKSQLDPDTATEFAEVIEGLRRWSEDPEVPDLLAIDPEALPVLIARWKVDQLRVFQGRARNLDYAIGFLTRLEESLTSRLEHFPPIKTGAPVGQPCDAELRARAELKALRSDLDNIARTRRAWTAVWDRIRGQALALVGG